MAPALVLVLLGLLGPVAMLQWREGRWLSAARWIARRLSPQLVAGIPMAGVLVMAIGLSIVWPPGIILVFLAAAGFLWAVFAVAQAGADTDEAPTARSRPGAPRMPTPPASGSPRGIRSDPGRPPGTTPPRPQSP
jgi:hypothetical protein